MRRKYGSIVVFAIRLSFLSFVTPVLIYDSFHSSEEAIFPKKYPTPLPQSKKPPFFFISEDNFEPTYDDFIIKPSIPTLLTPSSSPKSLNLEKYTFYSRPTFKDSFDYSSSLKEPFDSSITFKDLLDDSEPFKNPIDNSASFKVPIDNSVSFILPFDNSVPAINHFSNIASIKELLSSINFDNSALFKNPLKDLYDNSVPYPFDNTVWFKDPFDDTASLRDPYYRTGFKNLIEQLFNGVSTNKRPNLDQKPKKKRCICSLKYAPVCVYEDNNYITYENNLCFKNCAPNNARIVSEGRCPNSLEFPLEYDYPNLNQKPNGRRCICPLKYMPVCVNDGNDNYKTYGNKICFKNCSPDNARIISQGKCHKSLEFPYMTKTMLL